MRAVRVGWETEQLSCACTRAGETASDNTLAGGVFCAQSVRGVVGGCKRMTMLVL